MVEEKLLTDGVRLTEKDIILQVQVLTKPDSDEMTTLRWTVDTTH